jgi:hypothetical protein
MRRLGDGDFRAGEATNLRDLTSAPPDDAADHIGGDGDILRAEVARGLPSSWRWRWGPATVRFTRVGVPVGAALATTTTRGISVGSAPAATGPFLASTWVKQDGTQTPLPVLEQTFPNLLNGAADGFRGTVNVDDTFGRLG